MFPGPIAKRIVTAYFGIGEAGKMIPYPSLERFIKEAFHSVILEFDPGDPGSYNRCAGTLKKLEERIESSVAEAQMKYPLIARVRSHLAVMASELENHAEAEQLAADTLTLTSVTDPNFALAALIRVRSLHALGRHDEEILAALLYADSGGVDGQTLIHLIAPLIRQHPESAGRIGSIIQRVKAYASQSPELSEGISQLSLSEDEPMSYILGVADLIQKHSRKMTARALRESQTEEG